MVARPVEILSFYEKSFPSFSVSAWDSWCMGWGVIFDEASASSVRREKVQSFGAVWFMCKICIGTSARPPQHARMPGEAGFTRKRWTLGRNVAIFSMIWGRMIFPRHQPSYSQLMSTGCPITETKRIVFRFHYIPFSEGDWIPRNWKYRYAKATFSVGEPWVCCSKVMQSSPSVSIRLSETENRSVDSSTCPGRQRSSLQTLRNPGVSCSQTG